MKQKTTYALFGGSFDPPHLGHKEIIKEALKVVDYVVVVPTYLNPFKESFSADATQRLKWCKESFGMKNVEIDSFEVEQKRAVYTVETYKELSKKYNIKAIIIGADNLANITKWREFDYLNSELLWLVASREGQEIECSKLNSCKILPVKIDVSSTEIREGQKLDFIEQKIKKQVEKEYNL